MPRRPREDDRRNRRGQADERGRCLLARRRAQPDAAAHLRHRVPNQKSSTTISFFSKKRRSAIIASSAPNSTSTRSRKTPAAASCSGIPRARWCAASSRRSFAKGLAERGYQPVITPHIVHEKLYETSGHLENFAHGMFGPIEVEGPALPAQADELPRSHPDLQETRPTPTAICRSATPSSARSIASSAAARCTGSRACAASRRTTHICSARPNSFRGEFEQTLDEALRMMKAFNFDDFEYFLSTREHRGPDRRYRRSRDSQRPRVAQPALLDRRGRRRVSTGPSSTSTCTMRSAVNGSSAPCKSTSSCPNASS